MSCLDHRAKLATWGAALAALQLVLSPAWAHPGQHLDVRILITDEEVVYQVLMSHDLMRTLLGAAGETLELARDDDEFRFADAEQEKGARATLERLFKESNALRIDGVLVQPILRQMELVPAVDPLSLAISTKLPPDLQLTIVYPAKGRPKQVSMVWQVYPEGPGPALLGFGTVLAELDAYDENTLVVFTRKEPEITWHAPGKPVRQRVQPVVAEAESPRLALPVGSLLLVAFWGMILLLLFGSGRWRAARRPALVLTIVPAAAAVYLHGALTVAVAAPWAQKAHLPSAEEAADVFTALHRNVYRAFDYKTESDIYDVLAQSVAGGLLDQVYNEVYQGLILRDQGGAVARVQSVDILNAELVSSGVLPESNAPAFQIRSRWRVHGAVYHWGHVHSRTNEYQALYSVAEVDHNWKINGVEVLGQRRIVQPGDDPVVEAPPVGEEAEP